MMSMTIRMLVIIRLVMLIHLNTTRFNMVIMRIIWIMYYVLFITVNMRRAVAVVIVA